MQRHIGFASTTGFRIALLATAPRESLWNTPRNNRRRA